MKRQKGKTSPKQRKRLREARSGPASNGAGEKRLHEYKAALEAAESELEAFCYSVSHDLRAPLRCIDGFGHALLSEFGPKMDPQAREYLDRIVDAGKKMGRLIEELLTISRIQRGEIARENLNLADLGKEIGGRLRGKDPARKVQFVVSPKILAHADKKLMSVVLEELLDNAWKFTANSRSGRIELGQTVIDSERVVVVRDNGVGFDMEQAGKLFKAFQHLHSPAEYPGTGTGLALARAIVRRHGGRIWAESSPGKGAAFYFTLGNSEWH
jgi:light-regulated signal transduction histidine kinase (bacteriophytochrome)